MKSILLSIKPKILVNILNGNATLLIAKKFPKDYKGWVYIYCTKDKPLTYIHRKKPANLNTDWFNCPTIINGKVVARFWCDKVEEIKCYEHYEPPCDIGIVILPEFTCNAYKTNTLEHFKLLEKSCLRDLSISPAYHVDELDLYLKGNNGYAIHISQLEIFDKPKELSEFKKFEYKYCGHSCKYCDLTWHYKDINKTLYDCQLTKAPQNYCYIETEE